MLPPPLVIESPSATRPRPGIGAEGRGPPRACGGDRGARGRRRPGRGVGARGVPGGGASYADAALPGVAPGLPCLSSGGGGGVGGVGGGGGGGAEGRGGGGGGPGAVVFCRAPGPKPRDSRPASSV